MAIDQEVTALNRELSDLVIKRSFLCKNGADSSLIETLDQSITDVKRRIAGVSDPLARASERITLRPSVFISTSSDLTATGHGLALDILVDERFAAEQKVAELVEAIIGMILSDPLPEAAEQVYGILDLLVETSSIKGARP